MDPTGQFWDCHATVVGEDADRNEELFHKRLLDECENKQSPQQLLESLSPSQALELIQDFLGSKVQKQQEIILSLLNKLNEFNSYTDLLNLINALEKTFVIDENLTIPNATQLLWGYRNFNFSNVNKLTVPTKPFRTEDGREVLVLTDSFYNFLVKENLLSQP